MSRGGDWGARVSESLARIAPKGLLGIHTNLFLSIPPEITKTANAGEPAPAGYSEKEKIAFEQWKKRSRGYFIEQATRPQTIGFSIAETPIGLAAWLLDHDSHSYEQMAAAFSKGGHFASWEQPKLFAGEMRAAFRPMRAANRQVQAKAALMSSAL